MNNIILLRVIENDVITDAAALTVFRLVVVG